MVDKRESDAAREIARQPEAWAEALTQVDSFRS